MKRNLRVMYGILMLSAVLITSCATTKVSSVWKDREYNIQPKKIMVIGIAKSSADKRITEDEFVRQIKERGTDAVASYMVLPDSKQSNDVAIEEKVKELGADAMLIARLVSREAVRPTSAAAISPSVGFGTWHSFFGLSYQMSSSGYDRYMIMETNLYQVSKDNLIWAATSRTEIDGSDQKNIQSYISVMVKSMIEYKLLK